MTIKNLNNNFTSHSVAGPLPKQSSLTIVLLSLATMVTICEKLYFYAALLFALRG